MRNLHILEDSALIDLLTECTEKFTRRIKNFTTLQNDREYLARKEVLQSVILELARRGMLTHDPTKIPE